MTSNDIPLGRGGGGGGKENRENLADWKCSVHVLSNTEHIICQIRGNCEGRGVSWDCGANCSVGGPLKLTNVQKCVCVNLCQAGARPSVLAETA